MKKIDILRSNMAFNIIGVIVFLLAVFGTIVSTLGFMSFTDAIKKEYSGSTYHMADTATTLINGDRIDKYLAGTWRNEYQRTSEYLDAYCRKMSVSLVYVIKVDTSDYGRFVSVFNAIDNTVDNTEYTKWELGYERNATNEEYSRKYKALYDQEAAYETVYRTNPSDGSHPHITTMVPVKDSAGEVTAILCMQRPIRELKEARRPYLITVVISTILLSFLAGLFVVFFIERQVISPVRRVADEAVRFARENTRGEALGEISRYKEIAELAYSIDTMEADMVNYIENLTEVTAEKERIGTELTLARAIQENSLPNNFPAFPDRPEFDIYATMTPAREVGGDFYNFFLVDDDHLAMVIGDVSGKGVPAALFMMVTNILLRDKTLTGGTPAEILTFVNESINERNKAEMFVTLWLGILEIPTGRLTASNAGHEDAVICRKNGRFELNKTKHGLVCGVMPGIRYRDYEIQLEKGDKIFVYTDGVPEATDSDNHMFTLDRMIEALNRYRDADPQGILAGVHREVNEFVGDAPQFDDLTMMCIELK